MQAIKNIAVGFLVSFLGSLPLGYLNIVGYQIHAAAGFAAMIYFLLGVITVEAFIIYFTLIFADRLARNKKLLKAIGIFSILFLLLLAYVFFAQSKGKSGSVSLAKYAGYAPYMIGIVASVVNFIQIPFWIGWNLYLVNARYISTNGKLKFLYVFGTLAGTFAGMSALILLLDYLTGNIASLSKYLTSLIIPLVFSGMALYQSIQFYRKYYR